MNLQYNYDINKNGRIYPKEVFDRAYLDYLNKQTERLGEFGHPESPIVSLEKVSHQISDIKLRYKRLPRKKKKLMKKLGTYESWREMHKHLKLTVHVFDTPKGKLVKEVVNNLGKDSLEIQMRGVGKTENKIFETIDIISFDLIQKQR
jgi:hypothetical protein